jgi:hypothetical protein
MEIQKTKTIKLTDDEVKSAITNWLQFNDLVPSIFDSVVISLPDEYTHDFKVTYTYSEKQ